MVKIKNTQAAANAPAQTAATASAAVGEGAAAHVEVKTSEGVKPAKVTKPSNIVALPKTQAQLDAETALAAANAAAIEEVKKNAAPMLKASEERVKAAKEELKAAQKEQDELNKTLGIVKPKGAAFGGKGQPKVTHYTYVKDFAEGTGAPQARQILEIIKTGGTAGLSREDVVKKMDGVVKTAMTFERLLSYYTKPLREGGYVTTQATAAAPAAVTAQQ